MVTYKSRLSFNDLLGSLISVATQMHKAWEIAKENLEKAQERIAKSVNQHRRAID
jgi:hypothetical protein